MLDERLWTHKDFTQRMTTKEWKNILLNYRDNIVFRGNYVKLTAKPLGYGIVEVKKDI